MPLSNITTTRLYQMVSNAIPSSLNLTQAQIQEKIDRAMTYINDFYVNHNLGVYIDSNPFVFYNSAIGETNVREDAKVDTRWQIVPLPDFKPVKLLSCMLKAIYPADVVLPEDIEFVQDIIISIEKAEDINVLVPAKDTGAIAYLGGIGIYTVLSLDATTNTFENISEIDCFITYYRQVELPNWIDISNVDILATDVEWLINLVLSFCKPSHIDVGVHRKIKEHETNLIF